MALAVDDRRLSRGEVGRNLYQREQVEEAIPYFEESLQAMNVVNCESNAEKTKKIAQAHYWLAECYYSMKDYEMALSEYNASIEADSTNFQTYFDRGYLYQKLKAVDLAIEDFTTSIELNPDFASSYHNRGIGFKQKRMLDEAAKDLRSALRIGSKRNAERQPKTVKALLDILLPRALRYVHCKFPF
jgi:tetratricopeptide (TPR) repeat protein